MQIKRLGKKAPLNAVKEDQLFWEKHTKAFANCDVSRKAYCREQALNYDRFQYWYHKLKVVSDQVVQSRLKPIPVQVKAEQGSGNALGRLQLKNGHQLLIYERELLEILLLKIL